MLRRLRLCVQKGARCRKFLRRPTAHEVAQEGERRSGEPDERHAGRRAGTGEPHRLEHERHIALRDERGQRLDLRVRANGVANHRTRLELEGDTHALQRRHDVTEQNRRIQWKTLDGLQSDFGGELRAARERQEVHTRAQLPILGQIAPGLPHDPHGRVGRRLAPAGAQEHRRAGIAFQLGSHRHMSGAK